MVLIKLNENKRKTIKEINDLEREILPYEVAYFISKSFRIKMEETIKAYTEGRILVTKNKKLFSSFLFEEWMDALGIHKEKDNVKAKEVFYRGVKELIELENNINEFVKNMDSSEKSIKALDRLQEEFRIKGGYQLNERINKIKNGFKLSDELLDTEYNNLSGGEKTIINLASLVLSEVDVLLLDEPTNHLDIETLEWFEEYLNNYKG